MKLPGMDALGSVGLVGERKALSLLCLGFYTTLFFMITMSANDGGMGEWIPVFAAMTTIYGLAFFSVAAEWFWGRWFATGIGYWGVTMAVMAFVAQRSLPPAMIIFGVMHGLVSLCLAGEKMAAAFDAKPAWRERWKLDEQGVLRVRRSVTRAASSLPALVMFALAPREGAGMALAALVVVTAVGGLAGLLTARTWGVMALGISGLLSLGAAVMLRVPELWPVDHFFAGSTLDGAEPLFTNPLPMALLAGVLLCAAVAPFVRPAVGYLSHRR